MMGKVLGFFIVSSFYCVQAFADPLAGVTALMGNYATCLEITPASSPAWSNIISYWKFNEAAGSTTVTDSGPVGTHPGTVVSGVTLGSAGRLKTAALFNGTTGTVTATASSGYLPTANRATTFSSWVYPNSIGSTSVKNRILTFINAAGSGSTLSIGLGNSNQIQYFNGGDATYGTWTATITTQKWWHVALVYNGTCFQRYLNGKPDGTCVTAPLAVGGSTVARIGSFDPTTSMFDGKIDETAVWNIALTPLQIRTLYEQQSCSRN